MTLGMRDEREIRRAIAIARGHLSAIKRFGADEAWAKKEYGGHSRLCEWVVAYRDTIEILTWALGGEASTSTLIEAQDDFRQVAREMKVAREEQHYEKEDSHDTQSRKG